MQGGKFFFTAIKEGDELKFATDDENERHLWVQVGHGAATGVQALYRATGQAYKPVPPKQSSVAPSKVQGFADKASKHGMDELISADPMAFNQDHLFAQLQSLVLNFRLNEPICSLVRHSLEDTNCRAGSPPDKSSSSTNSRRDTWQEVVIDTCLSSTTS